MTIKWIADPNGDYKTAYLGIIPVGRVFLTGKPRYINFLSLSGIAFSIVAPARSVEKAEGKVIENTLAWIKAAELQDGAA